MERRPFPTTAPAIHWVWLLRVMKGATPQEVATLYGVSVLKVKAAVAYLGVHLERPTIIPPIQIGATRGPVKRHRRSSPFSRVVSRSGIRYIE